MLDVKSVPDDPKKDRRLPEKTRLLLFLALIGPVTLVGARTGLVPRQVIPYVQGFATSPGPGMLADERYNLRFEAQASWDDGNRESVSYHDLLEGRLRTRVFLEVHLRHFLKESRRLTDPQLTAGIRYFLCAKHEDWGWSREPRRISVRIFSVKNDFNRVLEVPCSD